MVLYRISCHNFDRGILVTKGTVVSASEEVQNFLGQPITSVKAYCQKKGWTIELVDLVEGVEA